MELKCYINGVEYASNLVQGVNFAEEYNETLDSGTIIISGIHKLEDLKPYDDVFIYQGEFTGYPRTQEQKEAQKSGRLFYKHLLIDQFSEKLINIDEDIYEYTIELFSETKKLETIQLPNTSITQPLNIALKRSVWAYLNQYVDLYSPLYKVAKNKFNSVLGDWVMKDELVMPTTPIQFKDIVLNIDGVFYTNLGIGNIGGTNKILLKQATSSGIIIYDNGWVKPEYKQFAIKLAVISNEENEILFDFLSMNKVSFTPSTSDKMWYYTKKYKLDASLQSIFDKVYCPDFTLNAPTLKDILTQLMLVKDMIPYVEDDVIKGLDITKRTSVFNFDRRYINNVVGSMSSSNYANNLRRTYSNALSQEKSVRRTEYLGFRNSDSALMTLENMRLETAYPIYKINKVLMCYYKKGEVLKNDGTSYSPRQYRSFMCKQDITPLILLNSTRNLLSLDWNDFLEENPQNIDELAQYKLCTLGYDIGSKYITGFGTKYNYPVGWWGNIREKTYIENIATLVDYYKPYGIYTYDYVAKQSGIAQDEIFDLKGFMHDMISPNDNTNDSLKLKALTFIVDYDAFYNGAVVHSKEDDFRDDITINDNSSSSLTLLEKDGLFQKEKLNRFGNKAIQINATYNDYSQLQELGSVYQDDVIIYHREYAISDKGIIATYYGTKDYVLKNYFVSVYAKHRTYNLMSYGESVNRAENKKMYINLSKSKSYYENQNQQVEFNNFTNDKLELLLSAFKSSEIATTIDYIKTPNKVNAGYITYLDKMYLTDVNAFVSGYSICFNLKMYDNASMGVNIYQFEPIVHSSVEKDFTGSVQKWELIADYETGTATNLGFYVGHIDTETYFLDNPNISELQVKEIAYPRLFRLPYVNYKGDDLGWKTPINVIGKDYQVLKDNKETIDMTMQFEPITSDKDILFSQWLMKLSDLLSSYNKVDATYNISDEYASNLKSKIRYVSADTLIPQQNGFIPTIIFEMDLDNYKKLDKTKTGVDIEQVVASFNQRTIGLQSYDNALNSYQVKFLDISSYEEDAINFDVEQTIQYQNTTYTNIIPLKMHRISSFGKNNPCPKNKVWFSNAHTIGDNESIVELFKPLYYQVGSTTEIVNLDLYNCQTPKVFNIGGSVDDFESRVYNVDMFIKNQKALKDYPKNMFMVYSDEPLKKTLVYDELAKGQLNVNETEFVEENISFIKATDGTPSLVINTQGLPITTKSIQYWYYDENSSSYNFVFGVNINEKDIQKGELYIYLSLLSTKDTRVYNDNHLITGTIHNYIDKDTTKPYGLGQYYD